MLDTKSALLFALVFSTLAVFAGEDLPPPPANYLIDKDNKTEDFALERARLVTILEDRQLHLLDPAVVKAFGMQTRRMLRMSAQIRALVLRTGLSEYSQDMDIAPVFLRELMGFYHQENNELEVLALSDVEHKPSRYARHMREVEFALFFYLVLFRHSLKLDKDPISAIKNKSRVMGNDTADNAFFSKNCLDFIRQFSRHPSVTRYVLIWMSLVPESKTDLKSLRDFYNIQAETDEQLHGIVDFIDDCEVVRASLKPDAPISTDEVIKSLLLQNRESYLGEYIDCQAISADTVKAISKNIVAELEAKRGLTDLEKKVLESCKARVSDRSYPSVENRATNVTETYFGF